MQTIDIGNRKQLFIDNRWFQSQRGMTLTMNPPVKKEIILKPENPWEDRAVFAYSSILEHDGKYKMWYDALSELASEAKHGRCVCYAESDDGVNWERKNVNLFEWEGIRENNIVMPGTTAGVMLDPNGPDEHRFKALCNIKETDMWPESKGAISGQYGKVWRMVLYLCTSPDGIHWKRCETPVSDYFHDTQNQFFHDRRLGRYVAYVRTHHRHRTVGRLEVDDPMDLPWASLGWDDPDEVFPTSKKHLFPTALTADESDPPDMDLYNPCVLQYPWADDAYFSFPSAYRHYATSDADNTALDGRDARGRLRNTGPVDIQLAVSRDGVVFDRPDRRPYVSLGVMDDWDGGQTYMGIGMLGKDNEIWMYDSPTRGVHGDREAGKPEKGMRRLVQRLDGFMSADAAYEGAEFTTPLLTFSGTKLELNVDCSAVGRVWVEIRDENNHVIPGYGFKESVDIDRNQIAAPVLWREKENVGELAGRPVRFHFKLRACKLYAFQFPG